MKVVKENNLKDWERDMIHPKVQIRLQHITNWSDYCSMCHDNFTLPCQFSCSYQWDITPPLSLSLSLSCSLRSSLPLPVKKNLLFILFFQNGKHFRHVLIIWLQFFLKFLAFSFYKLGSRLFIYSWISWSSFVDCINLMNTRGKVWILDTIPSI